MREYRHVLNERKEELETHLSFISQIEASATGRRAAFSAVVTDTDAINILKSGLLLHLYNIVEAVMTKILEEVGLAAQTHVPRNWCDGLLREWALSRANLSRDILLKNAETRIVDILLEAVERSEVTQINIRRRSGNWSHKQIEELAAALQCPLVMDDHVRIAACLTVFEDQKPPMAYIRHMRNQLAHGNISFVDGARHLTSARLGELSSSVVGYISEVADSFDRYIDGRNYLMPENP